MKQAAMLGLLVLVLAACVPTMNVGTLNPNDPCYQAQVAEIEFIEGLDLGYGSGVFDTTYFASGDYLRVTWWGYQNMWWTSFESGGPLGRECRVSRGST
jgi:hypothetical protein